MLRKRIKFSFIFIIVVFILMPQSIFTASSAGIEFPDMQGHWAKAYVDALVANGAVNGFPDGTFRPGELVTTNQFVTMLIRSQFGVQLPSDDDPAPPYMRTALQHGVIDGGDVDAANLPLDRISAARISHMFFSILGEADDSDTSVAEQLVDYSFCTSCRIHVEQVYTKGVMTGRPGFIFDGDATLTRAEAATIIMRLLDPALRIPPKG